MKRPIILFSLTLFTLTIYGQTINSQTKDSLRNVICKMLEADSYVRTVDTDVKMQKQIDSIHFYQLTEITKKFGYPDKKRIGDGDCNVDAFRILLHNPDRLIKQENVDLYVSECTKGNLSSWELGLSLDRYYVHYFKKSMYGMYGKDKPCLEDMETVNKNRRMIHLKEMKKEEFKTCQ